MLYNTNNKTGNEDFYPADPKNPIFIRNNAERSTYSIKHLRTMQLTGPFDSRTFTRAKRYATSDERKQKAPPDRGKMVPNSRSTRVPCKFLSCCNFDAFNFFCSVTKFSRIFQTKCCWFIDFSLVEWCTFCVKFIRFSTNFTPPSLNWHTKVFFTCSKIQQWIKTATAVYIFCTCILKLLQSSELIKTFFLYVCVSYALPSIQNIR